MKTILALLSLSALWFSSSYASGWAAKPPAPPPSETYTPPSQRISAAETSADLRWFVIDTAAKEIGTVELTGHNDGSKVEAYLASTGNSKGDPYCAAFVYYCGQKALGKTNPYPRSAWSPDQVANPTWTSSTAEQMARPGDVFGIYSYDKGRIAHCGFVAGTMNTSAIRWKAPKGYARTIEANTPPSDAYGTPQDRDAGKNGGVYSKLRPWATIKAGKSRLP